MECDGGKVYKRDRSVCGLTIADLALDEECDKNLPKVEGCFCPDGQVSGRTHLVIVDHVFLFSMCSIIPAFVRVITLLWKLNLPCNNA